MINNINDLLKVEKAPHLQRLLTLMLDDFTFESSKRIIISEFKRFRPLITWEDLECEYV